jgi:hypothetical protein
LPIQTGKSSPPSPGRGYGEENEFSLRAARWPLDSFRPRRAAATTRFSLVVQTWLGGGTVKAITDIEETAG